MSLTLGELIGYIRGDDSQFVRALDGADARMHGFQADVNGTLRRVEGETGERGRAIGEALRGGIDETLAEFRPQVRVGADARPADEEVARLFRRLEELRATVDVDVPPETALRELDEIHASLNLLSQRHADPQVRADTAGAVFALNNVRDALDEVDRQHPQVTVDVHAAPALAELHEVDRAERDIGSNDGPGRAGGMFNLLGTAVGGVLGPLGSVLGQAGLMAGAFGAVVPMVAGVIATLVNIVPAAAIAATAVLSLASAFAAVKIGGLGVGSALKAAFAPPTGGGGGGGGGAGSNARQLADAMRQVKDATQAAAVANHQAAEQTARDERAVSDAQKAARQAQADLNSAREQATRDLQDMNESLADAYIDQQQAILDVQTAQEQLTKDKAAGSKATAEQIQQDEIDFARAKRRLEEQQITTQRLQEDTTKANKAGVEGSKAVTDAKQKLSNANRNVADQELALADQRAAQARTAAQGLENIQKAEEALAAAGAKAGGGGGGVNKLGDALAKLSPSARAFVMQVIALKGAWTAMQQAVQERLFLGLAGVLKSTAASVLPVLRTGLVQSAGAMNLMAKGVLNAASGLAKDGTLGRAMASASGGLHNLAGIPGIFVRAMTQIAAAGGPGFQKLTASIGGAAAQIGKVIDTAFKNGSMTQAINTAIGLIKEIGQIAGNVFRIIGSVMGAAQATGGGFLGVLRTITGQLATAFASPAIQGGLKALFSTMELIGRTVAPLLVKALGLIAPVLTKLAPPAQRLITALGNALSPILDALGPVLLAAAGAVGALADAVSPLLPVVGQMIASLGPVLTPILQLIGQLFTDLAPVLATLGRSLLPPFAKFVGTVATAFKLLAPVLDKAVTQLGTQGLTPIIVGLAQVIGQFVTQYSAAFLRLFQQLLPVVPQLIPVLVQLGQSIGQILIALAPLLPQITLLGVLLVTELLPAILPLLPLLVKAEVLFLRLATGAITRVVIPALKLLTEAASGLLRGLRPMLDAVEWVTTHIVSAFRWLYDTLLGHSIIPDIINGAVRWFASLPGRAWSALASLAGNLVGRAATAGSQMVRMIRGWLSYGVAWIATLPGRALNALGDLSGVLYRSGQALIGGFVNGITSMIDIAGNAVSNVLGFVKDHFPNSPAKRGPFSGKGWTWYSGIATATDFLLALESQKDAAGRSASLLMAAAQDGLAAPGTPMGALVTQRTAGASGYSRGGGGSYSTQGDTRHVLVLQVKGRSNDLLVQSLRESISNRGGNAQIVLGSG